LQSHRSRPRADARFAPLRVNAVTEKSLDKVTNLVKGGSQGQSYQKWRTGIPILAWVLTCPYVNERVAFVGTNKGVCQLMNTPGKVSNLARGEIIAIF